MIMHTTIMIYFNVERGIEATRAKEKMKKFMTPNKGKWVLLRIPV